MLDSVYNVAEYQVLLDGVGIDAKYELGLSEIRVIDYLALPDLCTFTVGLDTEQRPGAKHPMDSHPFGIGKALRIALGKRDERQMKKVVFDGEIVTLEPDFSTDGASITVRALDRSHKLQRSRNVRTFQNQTASDIVGQLCSEAGLTPKTDSSGGPFTFMQQDNETDLDFIWRLAHRIGFGFRVDGTKAYFKAVKTETPIELQYPVPLYSFKPRLTAVQQVTTVTVNAWDPKAKKAIRAQKNTPQQAATIGIARSKVTQPFGAASLHVATEPVETAAAAAALAQSLLDRIANSYVTAEGTCFGEPRIRAGTLVAVAGIGTDYSGTYRVQSTTHVLRGGSTYDTQFSSTAIQTITGAVAASKPAAFGDDLVIGVVTNNKDEERMGRVRVKSPTLDDATEGWWARVLSPGARSEHGLMMLPKPGDEVLVGFEHGDTTRPLVLGSLHNGTAKPGKEVAAEDGSLGVRSDEKLVMRSKKDMTISSDATYDLHVKGNATVAYDSNLDETVKGQMTVKGNTTITVEAGTQLTIKGAQISIEATGNLALKGQMVDIKGSTVNIGGGMVNLG